VEIKKNQIKKQIKIKYILIILFLCGLEL